MKAKRIPWKQDFLVTDNNQVFNTKSNKYLKPSNVGGVNLTYKGKRKTLTIKQIALYTEIEQPQTLEQWEQIPDCKDFALSTEDRLKNIRFDKIIIPNADGKLRFYNEKGILEMDVKDIRDYFFAEDSAPEQKAEEEEEEEIIDDWDDDTPSKEEEIIDDYDDPPSKEEEIIDDYDDDGNEIIHDSPKKEDAPVQYGVPIKTATGFKVISDPRDVPPEFRPLKYLGEPIELPDIDDCTDKELAEREIAQNQFLDELWAKWEKDRRGY